MTRWIDFTALKDALGTASVILVSVIVFLLGLDDFLGRIMGLDGGHWQTWMDITSNMLFMFVLVICVLYAANIHKK